MRVVGFILFVEFTEGEFVRIEKLVSAVAFDFRVCICLTIGWRRCRAGRTPACVGFGAADVAECLGGDFEAQGVDFGPITHKLQRR